MTTTLFRKSILPGLIAMLSAAAWMPVDGPSPETVALAVPERIEAQDIPDFGLVSRADSIIVLAPDYLVADSAFSRVMAGSARPVRLLSHDSVHQLARSVGETMSYVELRLARPAGGKWGIVFAVGLAFPRASDLPPLCCCVGTAVYRLADSRLVFEGWGEILCD